MNQINATCRKCGSQFTYNHVRGKLRVNCESCKYRAKKKPMYKDSATPSTNSLEDLLQEAHKRVSRRGWKFTVTINMD